MLIYKGIERKMSIWYNIINVGVLLLNKKVKNVKKFFLNNFYKISRFCKWNKQYLELKFPFSVQLVIKTIFAVLCAIVCIGLFTIFLYKSKILLLQDHKISFNFSKSYSDYINMTGIITTQVSLTLLVVSISSLIANIESKYVYGKKALDLVFHKKGLFSFKVFLFLIFLLNFLNIYFLINQVGDAAIITIFIISILVIAFFVYRFVSLFIGSYQIKITLLKKYYKSNIKHLKRAKPLNANQSNDLEAFKNVTIKAIRENNVPIYNENINAYFILLEQTLFNQKRLVQEYYTEKITHSDLIAHIASFSLELLEQKKYREGINIYNRLYSRLNYFQTVNISNLEIYFISSQYIERMKYITYENEAKEYCSSLTKMIELLTYQVYLYSKVDLSYCRLYKHNSIYFLCSNTLLQKLYLAVQENHFLDSLEKSRIYMQIFDYVRTSEHSEKFPATTIDDFLKRELVHNGEDIFPIEIKAEPIALLILKMFENKDEKNIQLFLKMNISNRLMFAVKTFILLSIIEMLYHGNKKKFVMDLNIDPDFTIEMILKNKVMNMSLDTEEMIELYKILSEKYVINNSDYVKGSYYGFCPKFRFSKSVVDTYFITLMKSIERSDHFISLTGNTSLSEDMFVIKILERFRNKRQKVKVIKRAK